MPLTESQAAPGNTVAIDGQEFLIVDSVPSTRGSLLVVQPNKDSVAHVLVYQGDLIDHPDTEHVSVLPPDGNSALQNQQAEAAQDAKIADLQARLDAADQRVRDLQAQAQAPAPAPTPVPDQNPAPDATPTTDATGTTDASGTPPSDPSAPTQVVTEG